MTIHSQTSIDAPIHTVFTVLTDLTKYSTWLPQSSAYKGTTSVSDSPVQLGTTYIESNPSGIKIGKVIEFDSPHKVTFSQPLKLKPFWLGLIIDVRIEVKLREDSNMRTLVERDVVVEYPLAMKALRGVLDKAFVVEGNRTMEMLKNHVETLEGQSVKEVKQGQLM